ncbi:MAG: pyruvate:ferredoxin (flavodoxin) oxidoreductase [Planctomycetaceae bacterium]
METQLRADRTALRPWIVVDGNEAAARVAHRLSEVIAIYPITPSSAMGEFADAWSAAGQTNLWGAVPEVIEMQSEGGAAGALHGALQAGALATTFTASQGLLLMLPNMFKIAGELTPFVMHVAARTLATHALSIFGDQSDVMAARPTGFAMLCASTVQEAQDLALVAHAATLRTRIPFLHFFDGFRTSHEVDKIRALDDGDLRAMIDDDLVRAHRERALSPERPKLRGSAQNPDVFFQAREACNPFYLAVPDAVQATMDQLGGLTGRAYRLFDYVGDPQAERVVVLMGSGAGAVEETVETLRGDGERVGMVKVRLFRPFSPAALVAALPDSVRSIAVLDRTKEPGAPGEPLYQDVVTALAEEIGAGRATFVRGMPRVIGGRYGLSSKEFTPAMAKAVFDELAREEPKAHFTVGIVDDVTGTSLPVDATFDTEDPETVRAVFFGLGSDGTVSANKNSIKIIGDHTELHTQGFFVYDSKKSGAATVSHLRFGPRPIRGSYLVTSADFVACHQFERLEKLDVLGVARPGATFLLNSPFGPDEVWDHLPAEVEQAIVDKGLRFFVVDGYRVAEEAGLGTRINTVLQTCFFALTDTLPLDEAVKAIKDAIVKSYGKRGETVLTRNFAAVDGALSALHEVAVPTAVTGAPRPPAVPPEAPEFVQRITAMMLEGKGDLLPVSALPVDGSFPTDTARWEKRSIAREIPIWDPSICIDCAKCALVCPHAAIRMKVFEPAAAEGAPAAFQTKEWRDREHPGRLMTIQVAPDDCTGCGVCVDVCPARSKTEVKHKAIDMLVKEEHLDTERANWDFFLTIPDPDRHEVRADTVKGSQQLRPLFEFSGACAGCGETPYLKVLTQLFGDRMIVANATGCSSIYGGNLPTTPWATDEAGRGPAWANSLFEDNAEFGLGMRLALDAKRALAVSLLKELAGAVGEDLASDLIAGATLRGDDVVVAQRERVATLRERLRGVDEPRARNLEAAAEALAPQSVWIVGGDGWAYDIGFGGLDHVLASGRDVNVIVLDTEVYSNTGGQASKSTPRGAVAKFAAAGKGQGKKDLGMIATAYGDVYVATVAMGADMPHTVKVLAEAEAHPGPSLVIAYSTCIAHGIDMSTSMAHQKEAVDSGYWPLYRFDPGLTERGEHPFHLDSKKPSMPLKGFASKEVRYAVLERTNPERAAALMKEAQADVDARWHLYEQMAGVERGPENGHEPPAQEEAPQGEPKEEGA